MHQVTTSQLTDLLVSLGVCAGDGLLVHSAVQFLGKPQDGLETYLQALLQVLDIPDPQRPSPDGEIIASGTLAVPTFNFAFARGEPFDPQKTPSAGMGVFSEYVRCKPNAMRTNHPLQSLSLIGRYAGHLARRDTPSAFDTGSAFERMLELDFKILLLGASIQAVSLLHLSEQRIGVPYRYWKSFTGKVVTEQGLVEHTCRMYVRDLKVDAHIELYPVQSVLEQRGQWFSVPLNYGIISLCRMVDFVKVFEEFITRDPWSLVVNR